MGNIRVTLVTLQSNKGSTPHILLVLRLSTTGRGIEMRCNALRMARLNANHITGIGFFRGEKKAPQLRG